MGNTVRLSAAETSVSPKHPDRVFAHPFSYKLQSANISPRVGRAERESDHSPPSIAILKYARVIFTLHPHVTTLWCPWKNLLLTPHYTECPWIVFFPLTTQQQKRMSQNIVHNAEYKVFEIYYLVPAFNMHIVNTEYDLCKWITLQFRFQFSINMYKLY